MTVVEVPPAVSTYYYNEVGRSKLVIYNIIIISTCYTPWNN